MIIGICGPAGVGKDTVADMLIGHNQQWVKVALADPLKRICKEVFEFSDHQLWGPSEARNEPDTRYARPEEHQRPGQPCLTPRHALQTLGTEWGRTCYNDVWVDYMVRIASDLFGGGFSYTARNGLMPSKAPEEAFDTQHVLVPDVRFQNEALRIKRENGMLIRVHRPMPGLRGPAGQHVSETEVNSIPDDAFDYVVMNTGTMKHLQAEVDLLYEAIQQFRKKSR